MKINEKIYSLRKKHNLSQEELADKLNVSRQTVSKWELGESCPDFDKIVPLCEVFNIGTEELLRDKEVSSISNTKGVDVVKSILICVSIFFYFLALIGTVIVEEVAHLDDGLVAATFLTLTAIGTIILVFTLLTRRSPKQEETVKETVVREDNAVVKSIIRIFSLITTCIYLIVSFLTGAWHITWIIWLVYAIGVEIIRLIFHLKGVDTNEE